MNIECNAEEWRLFIDSSKLNLKAVLLYNSNTLPSIPLGHPVDMKETYDNVKLLLDGMNTRFISGRSVGI